VNLTVQDILMLVIGVIGTATALLVVIARNVVHSALYLVIALLAVAGTFLVLGAEFLAWAQVLVYVGAVVVLILFGLMLTRAPIGPMAQGNELGRTLPLLVSGGLFAFLTVVIFMSFGTTAIELAPTTTAEIGEVLYVDWAFPFMVLGFFLTVALVGAIILARHEEGEGPVSAVDEQVQAHPTPIPTDTTSDPTPVRR
jgi:NADH-quinone oxidoreductase subunit J